MSEDPYKGETGNIMTQNRYAYAENDPVNKLDPGGHMALLKKIKRSARRVAKKVVKTVKTVASRVISSVRGAPKKIASAVKSASNYSRASAKATLGYVRTKYKSAEQRAKDIRKTLKAQYNSLRKKVSCGIKKSATGGISKKEHYARNDVSYNGKLSQNEWIKTYPGGERQLINDAIKQKGRWYKAPDSANLYHRNIDSEQGKVAKYNNKYMYHNDDGSSYEVIINKQKGKAPYIVTDKTNGGTYNHSDPVDIPSKISHLTKDMLPYWAYKNNPQDQADISERVIGR